MLPMSVSGSNPVKLLKPDLHEEEEGWGPRVGGGHRGQFPSLEDTGALSPGWGWEVITTYGRAASPGTHCHTAGPPPRAQTSLYPGGCVHQLEGCLSQGRQVSTVWASQEKGSGPGLTCHRLCVHLYPIRIKSMRPQVS